MARLRDLLERFRPAGTPGAAARPGVPADRVAELSAELEPVLALLAGVEEEAERIRADGRASAERCRQHARQRAAAIMSDASVRATSVRADTAARARAAAAEVWEQQADSARAAADRLRTRAANHMQSFVDRAVNVAVTALDQPSGPASDQPSGPAVSGLTSSAGSEERATEQRRKEDTASRPAHASGASQMSQSAHASGASQMSQPAHTSGASP